MTVTDTTGCTVVVLDTLTGLSCNVHDTINYTYLGNGLYSFTSSESGSAHPGYTWYTSPHTAISSSSSFTYTLPPGNQPVVLWIRDSVTGCLNTDSIIIAVAAIDTVWPGDADANRLVDNNDLLTIGLGYDSTGPVRIVQGIVWQGDLATDWAHNFSIYAPLVNFNHADCNGDGIINAADTLAIVTNFGDVHAKTPEMPGQWTRGIPGLYLTFSKDTALNGDTLYTTISLSNAGGPVSNIYGLAFTFNYDPIPLDSTTIGFAFINSWLGASVNSINIGVKNKAVGTIKAAITGIDHRPRSGYGQIATFEGVITTGNINGKDYKYYHNRNYISDVRAIDEAGNIIPMNAPLDSNLIGYIPNGIVDVSQAAKVNIYPNPASTQVRITAGTAISSVTIADMLGHDVGTIAVNNKLNETIDISGYETGVYIIRVLTADGTATAKLVVSR